MSRRTASVRHIVWIAWTHFGLWGAAGLSLAQPTHPALTLRVAAENAVPGGWAQIKVYADTPVMIGGGVLALDLDSRVFGPIASVATFSASGDAIGMAVVSGTHVEAAFNSASGGIGQFPGVPVFVVRAPVLSNADATAGFVSLSLPASPPMYPLPRGAAYPDAAWTDSAGNAFQTTLVSGRMPPWGTLSVSNVTPGAGVHPAGTVLHIDGTGFDSSVKVSADGLAIQSVVYLSPTRIDVKTAGERELGGVRFHLATVNEQVDFFAAPPSAVTPLSSTAAPSILDNLHVILPLTEQRSAQTGSVTGSGSLIFLNPSDAPVSVLIREVDIVGTPISGRTLSVPAGAIGVVSQSASLSPVYADAAAPLRMALYYSNNGGVGIVPAPAADDAQLPALQLYPEPNEITANYQIGAAAPAANTVHVGYGQAVQDVNVQVDGGTWLQVTTRKSASDADLTAAFVTAGLSAGTYTGTITITPVVPSSLQGFVPQSSSVKVTLNVSAQPAISVRETHTTLSGVTSFDPTSIDVSSNGSAAAFTVQAFTDSGGNWLSTDVTSATTPATVNIRANSGNLPGGTYRGHLTVKGPANTVNVDVSLFVYPMPVPVTPLMATPASLTFVREIGASGPVSGASVSFQPLTAALDVKVATTDGGNWLTAENYSIPQNPSPLVVVNVNAANLRAGTYRGTITGTSTNGTAQASVALTVLPKPAGPLTVSPSSLTFNTPAGVQSPAQTLTVDSPSGPVLFRLDQGVSQLTITSVSSGQPDSANGYLSPARVALAALSSVPGTYRGTLSVTASSGEVDIPVTVNVTASPAAPPVLASVVNAASQLPGPLAPGEIVTVRGIGVGPSLIGLQLDSQGRVLTGAAPDARVEINALPAPVVYGAADQWNVIVPYELDGAASATVQVFSGGAASAKWTLPAAASAPGLFTIGSTGVGEGAVLNQDNTVNSPANPAAPGTIIQIFGTGAGEIVPAGVTAGVTPVGGGGRTRLPVKVTVGGNDAPVVFAGPAPGMVSGLLQVNAVVPAIPFGGAAIPLTVDVGGLVSQPGVTIAVQ